MEKAGKYGTNLQAGASRLRPCSSHSSGPWNLAVAKMRYIGREFNTD
jgi:hypothetical protein